MAGREQIPIYQCNHKERKDDVANQFRRQRGIRDGIVFIGVAQEKAQAYQGNKVEGQFQFTRDKTVYVNQSITTTSTSLNDQRDVRPGDHGARGVADFTGNVTQRLRLTTWNTHLPLRDNREPMESNRRTFVSMAGAAAASQYGFGQNIVRIGVIGVGGRGTHLMAREVTRVPNARVTHVCDVDQARLERAQAAAAKAGYGTVRGSADMRRVLEDRNVDAVLIATPDHWHAPAAILACDAGKDVYVEKPVSHNYREGRLLIDAARRNKRIVQGGLQSRSRPNTAEAVKLCHSGRIGRTLMAKAWNSQQRADIGSKRDGPVPAGVDYDTWVGPAEMIPFNENRFHYKWHWHWAFGTGDMGNDGVHQLDIARWALGVELPSRISGSGAKYFFKDDQQTPDTMNISFDYSGGKGLLWEMRIWHDYGLEGIDNGVAVYGTDGFIHIGRWERKWGYRVFNKSGKVDQEVVGNDSDEHMKNFIDCVLSRNKPNCEIEIGHVSTALCHFGNIVHRTGRNIAFDAAKEMIPGDAEANGLLRRKYRNHWAAPKGA